MDGSISNPLGGSRGPEVELETIYKRSRSSDYGSKEAAEADTPQSAPARRPSLMERASTLFKPPPVDLDLTPELVADVSKAKLTFTKYPTYNFQEFFGGQGFDRVGVPGSFTYDYSSFWTLTRFAGTSFQAVLLSTSFYFHVIIFLIMVLLVSSTDSPNFAGSTTDDTTIGAITSVTTFTLVFFTGRVYTRFNERFHDVCRTNGGVTVVTSLCSGYLSHSPRSRARALSIMRYTNAILNVYYMLISSPMNPMKWATLRKKGMLTKAEIAHLTAHDSPGVLLYSWAARLLQRAVRDGEITDMQAQRIETNISIVRGLAAKQIAYTLTQVPLVYFHILSMTLHTFLIAYSWKAAVAFYLNSRRECGLADDDGLSEVKLCYNGAAVACIIGQLWLIYLFTGLYMASVWMSDPMGTQSANYDLQVDLNGLWQESLNASTGSLLHEVDVPEPVISKDPNSALFSIDDCPMQFRDVSQPMKDE